MGNAMREPGIPARVRGSRRARRWVVVAALAMAGPAQAADPKPCQLLTEADVQAALGTAWKHLAAFSKGEVCAYTAGPGQAVTLLLTGSDQGAASILEGRRKMAGAKASPAPGPGSGAYRVSAPAANAVVFGKGRWVAQVEATPAALRDPAILDRLAKQAYDRLP